ncbi:DUF3147 family protein [Methylocella sp.]|uniref:DUF3147 family protein n=1 Tax=Methylocella sp. TaxID=1978226 RepID=UPI0035B44A49
MLELVAKALLSGAIVAVASEAARRWPGIGGLIASLPLVSILAMIWLWRAARDGERVAAFSEGTFWFVLPSLPMFLLVPALLRRGVAFWPALAAGCALTMTLYAGFLLIAPRIGLRL